MSVLHVRTPRRGADVVFHVASPYKIDVKDNMKEIVEPAVKGAQNVLSSVAKSKDTVRRVVFTSSVFGAECCTAPLRRTQ